VPEEYAIRKGCQEITLKVYPGATHGFDMEGVDVEVQGHRMLYNPEATADSIVQVREFLSEHMNRGHLKFHWFVGQSHPDLIS